MLKVEIGWFQFTIILVERLFKLTYSTFNSYLQKPIWVGSQLEDDVRNIRVLLLQTSGFLLIRPVQLNCISYNIIEIYCLRINCMDNLHIYFLVSSQKWIWVWWAGKQNYLNIRFIKMKLLSTERSHSLMRVAPKSWHGLTRFGAKCDLHVYCEIQSTFSFHIINEVMRNISLWPINCVNPRCSHICHQGACILIAPLILWFIFS